MTAWKQTRRPTRYPYERGLGRGQQREAARELLRGYLVLVAAALREHDLEVTDTRVSEEGDLEAVLTVAPADPARHDLPSRLELGWAEDIGWHVSHYLISTTPTPWRYLHTELVPAPATVTRFVALVAAEIDNPDTDSVGMLYPAQFRFRGQPLRPVLDELARHASPDEHHQPPTNLGATTQPAGESESWD